MNLNKYYCSECQEYFTTLEKSVVCEVCGKDFNLTEGPLNAEDYIKYIESELENANYHNLIELPNKLFNKITNSIDLRKTEKLDLARIICEEFYKNINIIKR